MFENISEQLKISVENVNAVITRDRKSTHDPPYPNHAGKPKKRSTGVQPWISGFELAWGRTPIR
jgi:hypothetical protein